MQPPRKLRRCALLNFPSKSFNVETLDAVIAEGFTDIGISVFHMDSGFEGTGFTLDQDIKLHSGPTSGTWDPTSSPSI